MNRKNADEKKRRELELVKAMQLEREAAMKKLKEESIVNKNQFKANIEKIESEAKEREVYDKQVKSLQVNTMVEQNKMLEQVIG